MADSSTCDSPPKQDVRRRVKLYVLNDHRAWDDRGTGFVTCDFNEQQNGMTIFVRSEGDGSTLLDTKIQFDTAYQKQQETLIVWSEGENYELALSFQEKAGCEDIWEKICQVQGKDPSVETTQDVSYESDSENGEVSGVPSPSGTGGAQLALPPADLSRLSDINNMFRAWLTTPARREHLALAIETDGYIKKLLDLFKMCEDAENIDYLHVLYQIFRSIFMLNKNALFEILFAEENLKSVIGVLEFDPDSSFETRKQHREFLWNQANYKEVIPFTSRELHAKIHQTYRAQYIQEVIFPAPSVFEENLLSTLNSFIFFNKVEIVSSIQDDEQFLRQLFHELSDENATPARRKELIMFLKEFCTFSQTLQPQSRESFFRTVSNYGILGAIEMCLTAEERSTRSAAVDILASVVEFNPSMARDHIIAQAGQQWDDDALLLNILIEQMFCDKDPELGGAVQLMGIIRVLIDPENMMGSSQNKTEKTEFLGFFYKRCMANLCAPLLANTTGDKPGNNDYHTALLLSLVLELLTFCAEHHTYHSRIYMMNKDIIPRALVLLQSKHSFLALSALRFFRKIIQLRDDCYNRHIVNKKMFGPIVRCFHANGPRYNLLNSALLELFEFIRSEHIKVLCTHFTENYIDSFKDVTYVNTFQSLKARFDLPSDKAPFPPPSPGQRPGGFRSPGSGASRWRRDARQMDQDEESYFNEDDDEEWEDDFNKSGSGEARAGSPSSFPGPGSSPHHHASGPPTPPYSPVGPADRSATPPLRISPTPPSTSLMSPTPQSGSGTAPCSSNAASSATTALPNGLPSEEENLFLAGRGAGHLVEPRRGGKENRISIVLDKKPRMSPSPPPVRTVSPETTGGKSSPVLMLTNKGLVDYEVEDSDEEEDEQQNNTNSNNTTKNPPPVVAVPAATSKGAALTTAATSKGAAPTTAATSKGAARTTTKSEDSSLPSAIGQPSAKEPKSPAAAIPAELAVKRAASTEEDAGEKTAESAAVTGRPPAEDDQEHHRNSNSRLVLESDSKRLRLATD